MKQIFLISLFVLAIIERSFYDLGPNFELITIASILAAFYFDKKLALTLTLITLAITDFLIGNSNIFIFTWSGFLFPILAINIFKKLKVNNVFSGTLAGISSNLFFFFWTNFGVWALDSWGMYPNTALGLMHSYINGLPFLKYQLTSTLFFLPIGFLLYEIIFNNLYTKTKNYLSQFVLT